MLRSSVHQSRVTVNMVYFGKTVHLSHDLSDMRDEVKVFQQHCGGENLCVFKGKLREGGQCVGQGRVRGILSYVRVDFLSLTYAHPHSPPQRLSSSFQGDTEVSLSA